MTTQYELWVKFPATATAPGGWSMQGFYPSPEDAAMAAAESFGSTPAKIVRVEVVA